MPKCTTWSRFVAKASRVAIGVINFAIATKGVATETKIGVLQAGKVVALVLAFTHTNLGSHCISRESAWKITAGFSVFVTALVI